MLAPAFEWLFRKNQRRKLRPDQTTGSIPEQLCGGAPDRQIRGHRNNSGESKWRHSVRLDARAIQPPGAGRVWAETTLLQRAEVSASSLIHRLVHFLGLQPARRPAVRAQL